jgi:5-oxoprolinase (ATP-hydrolysing)
VTEELFTHRFRSLVGEMGEQLRRTALSTNVKERLDFSCALLSPAGELVVNAPHIPVHLGALGLCVRSVREALLLEPGDVVVTNHPAFGGSHLPDVTVITPIHTDDGELLGYVASRAHHAEIGGSRPGSMPPSATTLAEEGVVIPPTYLLRGGEARWDAIRGLLEAPPFPSRAVEDNLADLRAAVAANHRGAELLRNLAAAHGSATVHQYMGALTSRAERRIREALTWLPDGVREATEHLDDGSPLSVRVETAGNHAIIDFAGSAPVHPGNLNATPAIVRSVVLYVLRLLVDEPIPLNEGLMRAVELRIPEGLLNPPFPADPTRCPAVVGGNTEVSQRLTDTLLKALGLVACSQGTMNNVLWGNERFGYYETVCGGTGAGPGWEGASAVHSHMTNTRITDPEVVEHRYPVRVERFGIRRNSGGSGRWRGGDGAVRELTFLEPMSLSVLTQHRVERPYGMEGGEPGAPGRQRVIRASGETVRLTSVDGCEVTAGDRLILETPGGGGWGTAGSG